MATIVTRSGKGSPLTHTEGDSNFTNLNTDKLENISEDSSPQLGANLDVNGNQIVSVSNQNVKIFPNGTGVLEVGGDGSSNDGTIQLNCSQNSHGVKIKSPPHSAGASYTLTLPTTDGNADEFLKTDGSGGLSWGTASGGGGGVSYALCMFNFQNSSGGSYNSASSFNALSLNATPRESTDEDGIVTLGSNGSTTQHFQLGTGKYQIVARVVGYYETGDNASPQDWKFQLYNQTDSTEVMRIHFNDDYDNIFASSYGRWPFAFTLEGFVNITGNKDFIFRIAANLGSSQDIRIQADGGRSHYWDGTGDCGCLVSILKVG